MLDNTCGWTRSFIVNVEYVIEDFAVCVLGSRCHGGRGQSTKLSFKY